MPAREFCATRRDVGSSGNIPWSVIDVDQLNDFAAQMEFHAVGETNHIIHGMEIFQRFPSLGEWFSHAFTKRGFQAITQGWKEKKARAANMVAVILGDNDVPSGLLGTA